MRVFAILLACAAAAPARDKPKPCVRFAPTWEAAVEEARALNLPLVVHRHGFY